MQQSKLIQFLRLLTSDEKKRFELFLASPYFNTSDRIVKFYNLIEKHYPDFDSPKLDKEKVYKALHGNGMYNDNTMRELISDLFKLCKEFAAHEQLGADELESTDLRYTWLHTKNADKLKSGEIEASGKLLEKKQVRNVHYYRHQWLHDYHDFEVTAARLLGAEYKMLKGFDITTQIHSLNRYYLINFFEVNIFLLATAKIFNQPLDESLVTHIDALAPNYINRGDISIDTYYNCFQLLRTDDEKYFFELKDRFFAKDPFLSRLVQLETGVTLENYCMKKIRLGDTRFGKEVHEIFRFEVEQGYCIENGEMSCVFYQNVVSITAEPRDLDWVEDFVEKYKDLLPAEFKEEVYCYAKAHILFARKKYQEALRQALVSNTSYFFWHKIMTKNLVARAQYELGMFDQLQTELDSYKHHLRDEKISEIRRENTHVFIAALRRLAELNFNFTRERLEAAREYIVSEKLLLYKAWFLEKLQEIETQR